MLVTQELSWFRRIAISINSGIIGALSINAGHELCHKLENTVDWFIGYFGNMINMYAHFP